MNNKLLDYIQLLSKDDKKDLTGKALKTTSEAGDLAEVVLSYQSLPGNKHKFVERQAVLNEAVDTILCAISCAYDAGFNHQEIEDMMLEKTKKWRSIQVKESFVKDWDKVPYEIHITVSGADKDEFVSFCHEYGVKPIVLDLKDRFNKSIITDMQTSSVIYGNNKTAYEEVEKIKNAFIFAGFNVVRCKIETVPWHPAAPSKENHKSFLVKDVFPLDCYFESHIAVIIQNEQIVKIHQKEIQDLIKRGGSYILGQQPPTENDLNNIANKHNAHLSRNIFKILNDSSYVLMVTLRSYEGYREDFEEQVENLKKDILDAGFDIQKSNIEFSLYDNNYKKDTTWLKL